MDEDLSIYSQLAESIDHYSSMPHNPANDHNTCTDVSPDASILRPQSGRIRLEAASAMMCATEHDLG